MSPTHDRLASRRLALVAMFMAPLFAAACAEPPEAPPSRSHEGIVSRADVERAMAMHRKPVPPAVVPDPPAPKAPAPPPATPKPVRPQTRSAAAPKVAPEATAPAVAAAPVKAEPVPEAATAPPPPVATVEEAAPPLMANADLAIDELSRIYSKEDPDVRPAQLLTAQGSVGRPATLSDVNTMELVISKLGRVETVKLSAPPKRMTDMLLLSGAKTWRFVPAMKDGQPVRYRTQLSWETTR